MICLETPLRLSELKRSSATIGMILTRYVITSVNGQTRFSDLSKP